MKNNMNYVEWANTLDSTGTDSRDARSRLCDPENAAEMVMALEHAKYLGQMLDGWKKFIFYGKQVPSTDGIGGSTILATCGSLENLATRFNDHEVVRLLHAIIGVFTESAELVEAFLQYMDTGTPIDKTNVMEETGDIQWYQALLAKYLGESDFTRIQDFNRKKLTARYGETWTQDAALVRDLNIEREILNEFETYHPTDVQDYEKSLMSIVNQLEYCGYEANGGHKLQNNAAFVALKSLAKKQWEEHYSMEQANKMFIDGDDASVPATPVG